MPLTLYVDGPRWRAHLQAVRDAHPGIVPVVKGNGYGFGVDRLAARAAWLGVDTVAVGMYHEVTQVAAAFHGTVMVLTPWRPFETHVVFDSHVVHTVGRLEDLRALAEPGRRRPARSRGWCSSGSPRCAGTASPRATCARPPVWSTASRSRGSRCTCRSPRART